MIQFVILENTNIIQSSIRRILRKFSKENEIKFKVVSYIKNNEELASEITNFTFRKVYFIDVDFCGKTNGMALAKKIREFDWENEIIFLKNPDENDQMICQNVFQIFSIIEKSNRLDMRLEQIIDTIYHKKYDHKTLKLIYHQEEIEIYMKNILYILRDKEERKAVIHTDIEEFKVNYSLSELLKLLDKRFIQTHKSCLANQNRIIIKNYSKGYFGLDTTEKVDYLSKKYKDNF